MYHAKNLGRQMKEAGDKAVDFVAIVGGEEWDRGEVAIKNFQTREQFNVASGEVVSRILGLL
jgi:histidyl-tRNA synthetase